MAKPEQQSPFALRISRHYQVDEAELLKFRELQSRQASYSANDVILERGDELKQLIFLTEGWALRCRYTKAGMRQIVHVLLPGDIATPSAFVAQCTDHEITALTDVQLRFAEPAHMHKLFAETNALSAAFWWVAEQEHGVLREQIVRLGRRSAFHRVPHLFLELHRRLFLVDQATAQTFELPLTQSDIADALGLSNVHVSRTL